LTAIPLEIGKIKHGFKTLAECGGIRGVDDTSSLKSFIYNLHEIRFISWFRAIISQAEGWEFKSLLHHILKN
jgi:hypothetical protein